MVDRADATGQTHKGTGDEVSNPDTYPRLPPGKTTNDHGRGDHPRVLDALLDACLSRCEGLTMFKESAIQKAT